MNLDKYCQFSRVTMYLKLTDDEIYTPVHLTHLTMDNLIKTLTTKFTALKDLQVKFSINHFE